MGQVGRVALLSRRALQTRVWQASLYEFEDVVADLADTTLLVPEPLSGARRRLARGASLARRAVGRSGTAPARSTGEPVDADVFLGLFATPWELDLLPAAAPQLARSAVKVAFVVELYPPGVAAVRDHLRRLRGFDHVFAFSRGALDAVEAIAGVPCSYLPTGVDALRFVPAAPVPRVADVVCFGRRLPGPHEALLAASASGDLTYLVDTATGQYDVTSHVEHRTVLAAMLARARYSLVHKINDDPGRLARTRGRRRSPAGTSRPRPRAPSCSAPRRTRRTSRGPSRGRTPWSPCARTGRTCSTSSRRSTPTPGGSPRPGAPACSRRCASTTGRTAWRRSSPRSGASRGRPSPRGGRSSPHARPPWPWPTTAPPRRWRERPATRVPAAAGAVVAGRADGAGPGTWHARHVHRWFDLADVPQGFGPSVVTIGNFDGVHRGHRAVLGRMVADARAAGGAAVAVTFDPHPAQVHRPESAPPLITGLDDRLELLASTGLDAALVVTYTLEFASSTPEEFVRRWLVDALGATTVVIGRDVRFGRGNAGDLSTMVALGERYGFVVEVIEDVHGERDPQRRWSSTWVRELLTAGDVSAAAEVLGRPHRVRGVVVHGDARGRTLGFPTANLGDVVGMVPADGVYAGWLRRVDRPQDGPDVVLPAAVSIGTNPTFDGPDRRVEAHVPDRTDLELYGEEVVLELVTRLRPMVRFASVAELVQTMRDDVARTREVLASGPAVLGGFSAPC